MGKSMDLSIKLKLIDKLTEPARRAQKALGGTGTALNKLQVNLKDTKAQQAQIVALKKTRENLLKNQNRIHELSKKLKIKGTLTDKQTQKLKELKEVGKRYSQDLKAQSMALNKAGVSTKNLTAAGAKLNARQDQTVKKIQQVNTKLKRTIALRKKLSKLPKSLAIGGAASLAGGLAVGRGVAGFFSPAIEFSKIMSVVQAKTKLDKSSPEFEALREQAKSLGARTSFTGSEVAAGQAFLAQASYNAEQIQKMMPAMVDLAKAGGLDLETTSDIASNIMGAFKLTADESTRVADILAHTAITANVDLQMLGETLKGVAPIAATAGAGLEEVAAMAGLLGNIGIQGSSAETALKNMYARMAAPPKDAQDAFKDLGISAKDAKGNLRKVPDILAEIAKATEKMGSAYKLKYFKAITGLRGMAAASELVSQAESGQLQAYLKSYEKIHGTAQKTRKVIEDNAAGDLEKMKSAWQGLSIESLTGTSGALRETIQSISELINNITEWTKEYPNLTSGIVTTVAVIGGLAVVGGTAAIALAGLAGPIKLVTTLFKILKWVMLKHPIIAIVSLLALAALAIYDNWGKTGDFFADMWTGIHLTFLKGIQGLTSMIPDSWLPDEWGLDADMLIKQIKDIEKAANIVKEIEPISQKIDTTATQRIVYDKPQQQQKSTVDVNLKIDSPVPVRVEKVKTTGVANVIADVGNLAVAYD